MINSHLFRPNRDLRSRNFRVSDFGLRGDDNVLRVNRMPSHPLRVRRTSFSPRPLAVLLRLRRYNCALRQRMGTIRGLWFVGLCLGLQSNAPGPKLELTLS